MSPAVWCAVLLLGGAAAAPSLGGALPPYSMQPSDTQHMDDETLSLLAGGGGGGGGGGGEWGGAGWRALDPGLYDLIDDLPRAQRYDPQRPKRKMPSLSISNPMEVLRQRLVLEIARKQMREHAARQAAENRLFLQNVGKRGVWGEGVMDAFREDN